MHEELGNSLESIKENFMLSDKPLKREMSFHFKTLEYN